MKVLKRVIFTLIVPMITFSVSGETLEELKDEYSTLIDKQESKMTMLNENYSIQDEIKKQIADIDNRLSDAHVDIDKIDSQMMEIIMKIDDAKKAYDEAVKNREEQYKKALFYKNKKWSKLCREKICRRKHGRWCKAYYNNWTRGNRYIRVRSIKYINRLS